MRANAYVIARPARRGRKGFSLIEVAVATVIIGLGVTALLSAVSAGTRSNRAGQQMTQAAFLAQEVREWSVRQNFDNLASATNTPPHDALGNAITGLSDWTQDIVVTWRNPASIKTVSATATDMVYVEVTISHKNQNLLTTGWLVTRRQGP